MLRISLLLLILSIPGIGQTQSFQGSVTYRSEIRNADPKRIPDSVFNMMYEGMPNMMYTYYYKDNRFKSVTDGQAKLVQIYEPSESRIYSYTEGTEVALWNEWNPETMIEKIDKIDTILGLECRAIVMRTNGNETTIYYSSKYKIDASKFTADNVWERCLREAGSVPLKYIIKGGGAPHVVVLTATKIADGNVSDEFFRVPKFKQVIKSPF